MELTMTIMAWQIVQTQYASARQAQEAANVAVHRLIAAL